MKWTQDSCMPARSEGVCLNDRTIASSRGKKKGAKRKRWCMQNKRVLCAEDETPWETKEVTSEVAGGGV